MNKLKKKSSTTKFLNLTKISYSLRNFKEKNLKKRGLAKKFKMASEFKMAGKTNFSS
jgi:hypothetical protein